MNLQDFLTIGLFLLILLILIKPLGIFIAKILDPKGHTFLDPVLKPLENLTYKILKIDPHEEQTWKQFLTSTLFFTFASFLFTYLVLSIQSIMPFNFANLPKLSEHLKFNIAVSFVTNTNWQSYFPESSVSYFTQMFALTVQNFISPSVALAVAACFVKGLLAVESDKVGNFYVFLIRSLYYLFLPLALISAIILISQGVPQNYSPYEKIKTIDPTCQIEQTILQGPIASQEAIKLLGTNGGGFSNPNSAHPFENPTPLSNLFEALLIILIPAAQIYYFGYAVRLKKHGWTILSAVAVLFVVGFFIINIFERSLPFSIEKLNVFVQMGNLEGKEMRFGIPGSSLFAETTTAVSCGAVNCMHESLHPFSGMTTMLNMQLGEIIFGGVGSGLYSVLIFVIVTIFFSGLIIGKTPKYLGKKIEAHEMKLTMLALLIFIFVVLSFSALSLFTNAGSSKISSQDSFGFSEILYALSSCSANNGSSFSGLSSNTCFYNVLLGAAMLIGRFCVIVPIIAMAGSFAGKKIFDTSDGDLPIHGTTFSLILIGIIILIGALTFLPALVMGPIMEYLHHGVI